jgi:hypothetical protein
MTIQVSSEVAVSFTAEAIRTKESQAIVRIQVVQIHIDDEEEIPLNDGYCFADIREGESLTELAARVARNPFTKSLATTWSDDKSDTAIRDYTIKSNTYESASDAHDIGPTEGWETVHDYHEGDTLVEVQVAETYGAWYYRTKEPNGDVSVYDDPQATREDAVNEARSVGESEDETDNG